MQEPDPVAIRAAARGDHAAFEQLVRAYQPVVWRFARHLLHDRETAEDVTQEAFLRAYRRLGTFRFQSKFSTWLLQITRHAAIDAVRARERRRAALRAVTPPQAQRDAAAAVELDHAIASLPLHLREAFVLVEVIGQTYRDAGVALGIPEGTVKSRVFHARRQLVAWLEEGGASHAL